MEETPTERSVATIRQVFALSQLIERRYATLVLLAAFTGLRWGELVALRRSDLDLERGTVPVSRKFAEVKDGRRVTRRTWRFGHPGCARRSRVARSDRRFPQHPPRWRELAVDAAHEKMRAASTLPSRLRRGLAGLRELGLGPSRPRLIEKTSLNRPTSKRRRLATVTVPWPTSSLPLIAQAAPSTNGARRRDQTLLSEFHARGEHPARLVVSVPVSGRPSATADRLGNNTGVRPIAVPTLADETPDSPRSSP